MSTRVSAILATLLLGLALLTVTVVLAQEGDEPAIEAEAAAESAAEEAKARAVENAASLPGATAFGEISSWHVLTAPLFVGVDDVNVSTYVIDPATGSSYPEFTGFEVWGAAYDVVGERLFFNSGATLYEWLADGAMPELVGTMVSSETATALTFVSLAHHEGALYGTRNIGTTSNPEGLYAIDPVSLVVTLVTTFTVGADAAQLGGLEVHPDSGLFYATNDDNPLRGLVQLDQNGDLTRVAPYPAGETDIDGLAISQDNRAYLLTDEPGSIYVFDFDTMTYTTPISNPWTTSELFAGAAWIMPAPDIQVSPDSLSNTQRPDTQGTLTLTIKNEGTADLEWAIDEEPAPALLPAGASPCQVGGDVPWASASPASGTTAPGESSSVEVIFDSAGLSGGVYSGTLCVDSNDPQLLAVRAPLTLTVESTTGVFLPVVLKPTP